MHTMCKDVLNPPWNLYRSPSFNGCYRFQHILCSIFYDSSLLYPIFLLSKGLAKEAKRRVFFSFDTTLFKKCLALHISLSQLGGKKIPNSRKLKSMSHETKKYEKDIFGVEVHMNQRKTFSIISQNKQHSPLFDSARIWLYLYNLSCYKDSIQISLDFHKHKIS